MLKQRHLWATNRHLVVVDGRPALAQTLSVKDSCAFVFCIPYVKEKAMYSEIEIVVAGIRVRQNKL